MTVHAETRSGRFEHLAKMLEATGDFRVLRRLCSSVRNAPDFRPCKCAIFLDVETTGLDHLQDTVIGLAMVRFDYDANGEVVSIGAPFQGFRDPGAPIRVRNLRADRHNRLDGRGGLARFSAGGKSGRRSDHCDCAQCSVRSSLLREAVADLCVEAVGLLLARGGLESARLRRL
jgi:hypothetical protein